MPQTISSPDETAFLVQRAQQGDTNAFSRLVARFQNATYALAYHGVGSFEAARDVAQEAFIAAFVHLCELRDPRGFSAYLRQITTNECRQWLRSAARNAGRTVPLETTREVRSEDHLESRTADRIVLQNALAVLSEETRLTLLLYYFDGYSVAEVAAFLEVPATTVKSRLRDARARLRKEMVTMLEETTRTETLPPTFPEEVVRRLFEATRLGDTATVRRLLDTDNRLAFVRQEYAPARETLAPVMLAANANQTAIFNVLRERGAIEDLTAREAQWTMTVAAFRQNHAMIDGLTAAGLPLTLHAAAYLGDAAEVARLLREHPETVQERGIDGETPLHDANTVEVARLLIDAGADVEARDATYDCTPLEYNCRPSLFAVGTYLIERGAHVGFHLACWRDDATRVHAYLNDAPALLHARRERRNRPNGDSLPITLAAVAGADAVLAVLREFGADINAPDERKGNATPLHYAALWGRLDSVRLLLSWGADATLRASSTNDGLTDALPAVWAEVGKRDGWGVAYPVRGSGQHDAVQALLAQTVSPTGN